MKWYIWVPWVLFALMTTGIIIWAIVSHYKRKNLLLEVKNHLQGLDARLKDAHSKLDFEGKARIQAEKKRSATELMILEGIYKKDLEGVSQEEKDEFEKAKADPSSGVDFMRDLIGGVKPPS